MQKKTRISGNNIDIGGATDITLITPRGSIKVKRITARDVNWATQVFAKLQFKTSVFEVDII